MSEKKWYAKGGGSGDFLNVNRADGRIFVTNPYSGLVHVLEEKIDPISRSWLIANIKMNNASRICNSCS
jgi:hypothetical protein